MNPPLLRVVSPHSGLRPESILGGEIYERELLARLPAYGIELAIGLPASRPAGGREGWRVSLLRPSRGLRWWVAPVAFVPFVLRALRRSDVDLLRGHSVLFVGPSLLIARTLARRKTPIVIHHLHTEQSMWTSLETGILRRATGIVTISDHSREQLISVGVEADRIRVVYPGVDVPERSFAPAHDTWPAPSSLRILFLGRLIERKRPDLAVNALAELVSRGLDASLIVAGDGPLRRELEQQAKDGNVAERVRFLGRVDDEIRWGLIDSADVVLFPSELEGFGFGAAEAQARGVPVIATEATATSEIVEHKRTGLLVAATPAAFADALIELSDAELRQRLGDAARESMRRFNWDRSAAEVAAFYRTLTSVTRPGHAGA